MTGLGGMTGVGAAAFGARFGPWSGGDVAIAAIRMDLMTRLVILANEGDEEKAKRVVESLQARLTEVGAKLATLAEQISALKEQKRTLSDENQELKKQLEAVRAEARNAKAVLEVVLDRLREGDVDG